MGVTLARTRTLTAGVKAVLASIALVALLAMTTNIAALRGSADYLSMRKAAESEDMSSQTFTRVVGSNTYSRTYVKLADETEAQFDVRAKALWEAYCDLHGI